MKKITYLKMKNFQSHQNTHIEFHEKTNIIAGPSDVGKSAIERAVRCVLYNEECDLDNIREGTDEFKIELGFNDGTIITRTRSKKVNRYDITVNGETLTLNSFGANVPKEVLDAHGMYQVKLGKKEIRSLNCASLLEGPFFLSNTAGERADIIGSIAKTEAIELAVANINGEHRDIKKTVKTLEEENKKLANDVSDLEYVDELKILMDKATVVYDELEVQVAKHKNCNDIFSRIDNQLINLARQENIKELFKDVFSYQAMINEITRLYNSTEVLEGMFHNVQTNFLRAMQYEKVITTFSNIDEVEKCMKELKLNIDEYYCISNKIDKLKEDESSQILLQNKVDIYSDVDNVKSLVEELKDKVKEFDNCVEQFEKLELLVARFNKGTAVKDELKIKRDNKVIEYQKALRDAGKCPTCFGDITSDILTGVEASLR